MARLVLYGTEGDTLMGLTWTWTWIAIMLFVLRTAFASKAPRDTLSFYGIRWDYIWVTIAFVTALISQIFITVSYHNATKRPGQMMEHIEYILYWGIISNTFAMLSMAFGRFAVVALLLSLHGTTFPRGRTMLQVLGVLQFLTSMLQLIITLFQCDPPKKLWAIATPGTCPLAHLVIYIGYLSGGWGSLTDFALAIYPAVLIVGPLQQMKMGLKVAICFIMSGGIVAGVAGVIMTAKLEHVDFTGGYGTLITWTLTQTWFIIIFGSLPTIRPFFMTCGRTVKSWSSRLRSKRTQQTSHYSWIGLQGQDRRIDSLKPPSEARLVPKQSEIYTIPDEHDYVRYSYTRNEPLARGT
ncbi:hypothetical protein DOTSEDRAFT_158433 [Lecanosticta acicola]|uniref:Rhodopsin domain-containing protein n=1 Tax=Lecanosticta acicola TaxID=111012 RepID=A0AAI8Z2T1_9PEZI|nr:hypothetical protein DOTSEDRAFT_158433 [Lecanosticta acicola]